jgi:hypothetical protein
MTQTVDSYTKRRKGNLVLVLLIAAAGLFLDVSPKVLAHQLAQDGSISAFLHVAPSDNPKPSAQNNLEVYFNDEQFKFNMADCDCRITVVQGVKQLLNSRLAAAAGRTGTAQVYLPKNNFSYGVIVTGIPKNSSAFQPFRLNFDIDVGNPASAPKNNQDYWAAGLSLIFIGAPAFAVMKYRRQSR